MIPEQSQTKQIEWIDVARGICIFLVCLGHRNVPPSVRHWIYSFHMPAFFIISGYVSNIKKCDKFVLYLKKKAKQLLIPYCALGAIWIAFFSVWDLIYSGTSNIKSYLINFVSGYYIGSSWFIIALFIVAIAVFFIEKLPEIPKIISIFAILIVGFYINGIVEKQPIWNLAAVPIGVFFFESGIYLRKAYDKIRNNNDNIKIRCLWGGGNLHCPEYGRMY